MINYFIIYNCAVCHIICLPPNNHIIIIRGSILTIALVFKQIVNLMLHPAYDSYYITGKKFVGIKFACNNYLVSCYAQLLQSYRYYRLYTVIIIPIYHAFAIYKCNNNNNNIIVCLLRYSSL